MIKVISRHRAAPRLAEAVRHCGDGEHDLQRILTGGVHAALWYV